MDECVFVLGRRGEKIYALDQVVGVVVRGSRKWEVWLGSHNSKT